MKKIILIMLALIMVLTVFVSCATDQSDSSDDNGATTPAATTPAATTPSASTPAASTPSGSSTPNQPGPEGLNVDIDSIDYNNESVYLFHWEPDNDDLDEFGMERTDVGGDILKEAVYSRNIYTENDLGVTLEWVRIKGTTFTQSRKLINELDKRGTNNDPTDIVIAQARTMPYFMVKGKLADLNDYSDTLDLSKAWWPESVQETMGVQGRLYFVSGDISMNLIQLMNVVFVNKTALGDSYQSLVENALDYKWTIDDLISLTENSYSNLDSVSGPSAGDKFGIVSVYYNTDALYTGMGYKYMTTTSDKYEILRLSSDMAGATAYNYVTKIKNWRTTGDLYLDPTKIECGNIFADGRSTFMLAELKYGKTLGDSDIDFGILPAPALDVDQGRYYTTMTSEYSAYGIYKASANRQRSAEVIQVLGYNAYLSTTPAVFEICFAGSRDDYAIQMFSIIRESLTFDAGKIYEAYVSCDNAAFTAEAVSHRITNVLSYAIADGPLSEVVQYYNFHSLGDPTRQKVLSQISIADNAIYNFLEKQK